MRKTLPLFIVLLISGSTFAQSFYWGYPFGLDDEANKTVQHIVDEDVYRLTSIYDLGIFNYRISADRFNQKDLEKLGSIDLGIPQPIMGAAMETHNSFFQVDGTDYLFFSTLTNRETSENNLLWQTVNIETGERSDFKTLTTIEGKNNSNNGQFRTAQSPNGEFFAVLKEPAFLKKTPETLEIELYDKNLNKISSVAHTFEWEAQRAPKHLLQVDDSGNVYFMKAVNLKKIKPYSLIYSWPKSAQALSEFSLQQPDDYQIAQIHTYSDNGNLYIAALLTHQGSATFGMNIDMDGRHSGTAGSALLSMRFSNGKLVHQVRNDFEGPIANLSIKTILPDKNNHFVVMERMFVSKKSSTTNLTATNITYDYSYLSNGFFISLLDAQSGDTKWNYTIDTAEPNTHNDNGAYLSVLPAIRGGNLVLLYNESRDIRTGKVHNPLIKRFPIIEVINPAGEVVRRDALTSAGVGVLKDERFDLDTGVIVPVSDNKYLIRARSNAEFKYGYLTF